MDRFVGRSEELSQLEDLYSRGISTCAVYGRRRVGKTALLQRFCRDKRHIFLTVPTKNREVSLKALSVRMSEFAGEPVPEPEDIHDIIGFLSSIDGDERTVIVIDEFPNLADFFPDTPSAIQTYVDHGLKGQNAMLIVCGSSIGAMRSILNEGGAPLFKRFPVQMRISPLPYWDASRFHEKLSEEDRIRMYALGGGMPIYHELMSGMSVRQAIERNLLGPAGVMKLEALNALAIEVRPWESYESLILAIHGGKSSLDRISASTGMSPSHCLKMLDNLIELGVVSKESPYGKKFNQVYRIVDGPLRFYYDIVFKDGDDSLFLDPHAEYTALSGTIQSFYGPRFEIVCRQYVMTTRPCRRIGSWWGTVAEDGRREDADVDIVAEVVDGQHTDLLLGECKFTNKKSGMREFDELRRRGMAVRKGSENKLYIMFSRSGFTDELEEFAEENPGAGLELVTMERIAEWAEGMRSSGIPDDR